MFKKIQLIRRRYIETGSKCRAKKLDIAKAASYAEFHECIGAWLHYTLTMQGQITIIRK